MVHPVIEVCDGYLHAPILFVVSFNVPVDSNGAHVVCALQQRGVVFSRCVQTFFGQNLRISPARRLLIMFRKGVCILSDLCYLSAHLTQLFLFSQPHAQDGQGVMVSLQKEEKETQQLGCFLARNCEYVHVTFHVTAQAIRLR